MMATVAPTPSSPSEDVTSIIPRRGSRARPLVDPPIVKRAIRDSFVKLNPRAMMKNPVMFVVEVGAVMTTILAVRDIAGGAGAAAVEQPPLRALIELSAHENCWIKVCDAERIAMPPYT